MQDPFADIPQANDNVNADLFSDIPSIGAQNKKPSLQEMIANYAKQSGNTFLNTILGAGDSVNNLLRNTSNAIMPNNMQVPLVKSGEGTGYGLGTALGDIAGFIGGAEGLEASRAASEAIPYLGKIAELLGGKGASGVARRALGNGTYGAIENPQDRTQGFAEGAALSSGLDALSPAMKAIRPAQHVKNIYQTISDSLSKNKSDSSAMYKSIMNQYGSSPIEVHDLDPEIFKHTKGLKDIYNQFSEEPTLENAHRLQSQLGSENRGLIGKDVATKDRKNSYSDARQSLLEGIYNSLGKYSPEAQNAYSSATQHYRENVLPFQITSDALQKISNPTPETVLSKLRSVTKKDLYPSKKIGEMRIPLIPKEISDLQSGLSSKIRNKTITQMLGSAAFGGTLAHSFGLPMAEELAISLGSGLGSPYALNKFGNFNNSKQKTRYLNEISKQISKYLPARKVILSTALGGQ